MHSERLTRRHAMGKGEARVNRFDLNLPATRSLIAQNPEALEWRVRRFISWCGARLQFGFSFA